MLLSATSTVDCFQKSTLIAGVSTEWLASLVRAAQDFRCAVRISERPSVYAEAAVSFFLHVQDYNSARELLPILDPTSDDTAFLTTVTEYYHKSRDKKTSQITAVASLANRETQSGN